MNQRIFRRQTPANICKCTYPNLARKCYFSDIDSIGMDPVTDIQLLFCVDFLFVNIEVDSMIDLKMRPK